MSGGAAAGSFFAGADALGRPVRLEAPPRRIVSLVPSLTELLADLGLAREVVGLTTFCVRPEGWREEKVRVGGTKQVARERLRALEPDLVLANKEENTAADVEAVSAWAPVWVTDVADVPGALDAIRAIGALTDRRAAADEPADEVAGAFDDLGAGPPLDVAHFIWRDPWMVAGGETFIPDVLARAGLRNVFEASARYPTVTADEVAAAAPAALLLSSEPFPFQEKHRVEAERLLPGARVELVDGELCSCAGSRLRHTPAYLRGLRARLAATAP